MLLASVKHNCKFPLNGRSACQNFDILEKGQKSCGMGSMFTKNDIYLVRYEKISLLVQVSLSIASKIFKLELNFYPQQQAKMKCFTT